MRSRIVSIFLCVLLFFSSIYLVGVAESENTSGTEATTVKPSAPVETIICSFKDISYGNDENQTLDLSLPIDNREQTGLVLYIHGGGWVGGDKSKIVNDFDTQLANKNYATASINYRLSELDKTDIYDIIDDITAALSRIKEIAAGYSVNINKVILNGYSAGGHLSLLYAYRYRQVSPIEIVAVFASSPACDLSIDEFYKNNPLGDEKYMCELMSKACGLKFTKETRIAHKKLLQELSPTDYVTSDCVPTVISHGKKDKVAPFKGSKNLSELLVESSVTHNFIVFEKSGHQLNKDESTKQYAKSVLQSYINSLFQLNMS